MAIGFLRYCRGRRLVALIAMAALLAQTLVAELAGAQATRSPADVVGVICHHGASGGEPADVPDTGKAQPDCCVFCAATAIAIAKPPTLLRHVPRAVTAAPPFAPAVVVIARTMIRAGRSQAPPRTA